MKNLKKFNKLAPSNLMRTEQFTPNYLEVLNVSEDNLDELIEIALDKDLELANAEVEKNRYIPCHAIQALGQMGTLKPFDEILERMVFWAEDDYYINAVMYYLRKVGKERIDNLFEYFLEQNHDDGNRVSILEVLKDFMEKGSEFNQKLEEVLVEYLNRDDELDDLMNASAIFTLIDLSGAKHIELIRKVFAERPVDIFYDGDLEDIEVNLGLKEERSRPREKHMLDEIMEELELADRVKPIISTQQKIGRNDPCPCGSGKKYKKCCLNK